jgi:CRP-like cAMP-binding protein
VVLRIIGAGDVFGGAGALGDLTYPIGAEAVEPAVALVWTANVIGQTKRAKNPVNRSYRPPR